MLLHGSNDQCRSIVLHHLCTILFTAAVVGGTRLPTPSGLCAGRGCAPCPKCCAGRFGALVSDNVLPLRALHEQPQRPCGCASFCSNQQGALVVQGCRRQQDPSGLLCAIQNTFEKNLDSFGLLPWTVASLRLGLSGQQRRLSEQPRFLRVVSVALCRRVKPETAGSKESSSSSSEEEESQRSTILTCPEWPCCCGAATTGGISVLGVFCLLRAMGKLATAE